MAWFLLDRLFWAGAGGSIALAIALGAGRIAQIHPAVKAWICRAALMKSCVGMLWAVSVVVGGAEAIGKAAMSPALGWYLAGAWLSGSILVLRRLVDSHRAALAIRRGSRPAKDDAVLSIAHRLGVDRVEVRQSESLIEPCVIGIVRPRVVLPTGCEFDEGVLAHEMAHIRHRDLAWNALAWVTYAIFWFVPGYGRLTRELALWQEGWADVCARQSLSISPDDQAKTLLAALAAPRLPGPAIVAYSGDANLVGRRIRAMFASRFSPAATISILLVVAACSMPLRPISLPRRQGMARMALWTSDPSTLEMATRGD